MSDKDNELSHLKKQHESMRAARSNRIYALRDSISALASDGNRVEMITLLSEFHDLIIADQMIRQNECNDYILWSCYSKVL